MSFKQAKVILSPLRLLTIEIIDDDRICREYGVFFHVRKTAKKLPLRLFVESAYAFDGNAKRPNTARQKIRFRVIVHNIICNKPVRFKP